MHRHPPDHSVMSGQAETAPGVAFDVNVTGTRTLLEACKALGSQPRFVFTSSIAVFGPADKVTDATKFEPQNTYGCTKAVAEMLVSDYSRRGEVDGRIARLPTTIVRPGKVML